MLAIQLQPHIGEASSIRLLDYYLQSKHKRISTAVAWLENPCEVILDGQKAYLGGTIALSPDNLSIFIQD